MLFSHKCVSLPETGGLAKSPVRRAGRKALQLFGSGRRKDVLSSASRVAASL
ncbi:hypothetical protein SAMCFNEI73_Ch0443 [Sinorhizobium americanum]|uniref:Uncharacterized protein n=1 Tax=Sinorhizobium americanum TaxID=194963 RepID=A0A1L3LIA3_9HYPH|nr:hypothetical protein SAMCCGM7_Ch0445 [Sinorhizobium americanum CCGM7]APG89775.1 hypothetical protein SAMCFNEI73_Ch0443 [Sinorhizobium americanum]